MKKIIFLFSIFFYFNCAAQLQEFANLVFIDSVVNKIIEPIGIKSPDTYYLLAHTDSWQLKRLYFRPAGPREHAEGMNLYAYNDSVLAQLIPRDKWNLFAHRALAQGSGKIKKLAANVVLIKKSDSLKAGIFFSVTRPVICEDFGMIDVKYFVKEDATGRTIDAWFQGQALLLFQQQSNKSWKLVRIVNRFVQ